MYQGKVLAGKGDPLGIWQLSVFRGDHTSEVRFSPGRDTDPIGVLLFLIVDRMEGNVCRFICLHIKPFFVHQWLSLCRMNSYSEKEKSNYDHSKTIPFTAIRGL